MPLILATTDLTPPRARDEKFLNDTLFVRSRSGLHATERALLERLPSLARDPARVVVCGNRTGILPAVIRHLFPQATVLAHTYDTHHRNTVLRTLATNTIEAGITCVTTANIPNGPDGTIPFDAAVLQLSRNAMPAELVLDLLEDVHEHLADGGACLIAFEGDTEWLRSQLKTIFGKTPVTVTDGMAIARAIRVRALPKRRDFGATFDVSLPGVAPFTLMTLPGVFAHRRADQGGLALAEVAARETTVDDRVLDIGCGCGMVGIALARAIPGIPVAFVDSHARAIACTDANARTNGLTAYTVECTDSGTSRNGFTLAVGNPPYFSDYSIADRFIGSAYEALAPGGRCFIVAKQSHRHEAAMNHLFGNAELIRRRDYTVVRSVK